MDKIEISMPLYEVRLSLTGRCNHNCIYCGPFSDGKADKGYRDLSLSQIKDLAQLLREKKLHIQLTGGEPTLRKDLLEAVNILSDADIKDVGLTTNGSKLSPIYAKELCLAGISDVHIHLPSLNEEVYRKITRNTSRGIVERIQSTALSLITDGHRVEFNAPVTPINLQTIPALVDFCYGNKINLKLIEEVSLSESYVGEEEIVKLLEAKLLKLGILQEDKVVEKKYGQIYDFGSFSFRVAPATKGLSSFLNGKSDTILYDGRYWIGGIEGLFMFTPTCFINPQNGRFKDLERNLNETIQKYNDGKK